MNSHSNINNLSFKHFFAPTPPNFYPSLFSIQENLLASKIPIPQSINQQAAQCYLNSKILLTQLNSLNPLQKVEKQSEPVKKGSKAIGLKGKKEKKKIPEKQEIKDEDSTLFIKNETVDQESRDKLSSQVLETSDVGEKPKKNKEKTKKKRLAERKKKNFWLPLEDTLLTELLRVHGEKWSKIASYFKERTGKQVRDRYVNYLAPSIKQKPWTDEEEALLDKLYLEFGKRWSCIATYLPGRTENQVKNNFYARFRRGDFNKNNIQALQSQDIKPELPLKFVPMDSEFQTLFNSEIKIEFNGLDGKDIKNEQFESCDLASHSTKGHLNRPGKADMNSTVNSSCGESPVKEEADFVRGGNCSISSQNQIKLKDEDGKSTLKTEEDSSDPYKKIKYESSDTEKIVNVKQEVL